MQKNIVKTQYLSSTDKIYIQQYTNDFFKQSQNISEIAKWLIGLEISIANFYLAIFVFLGDKSVQIEYIYLSYISLLLITISILFSILSVFPKKWNVNTSIIRKENKEKNSPLSLEEYFFKTAQYKYYMVLVSIIFLFFAFSAMASLILANWR